MDFYSIAFPRYTHIIVLKINSCVSGKQVTYEEFSYFILKPCNPDLDVILMVCDHTMEPEKYRVSGRVRVEPTRPEPDPKTRNFRVTRPEPDPKTRFFRVTRPEPDPKTRFFRVS
jgi:hypothetical protein